jgi:misacylated tRNA(Ala) deacylase
MVPFQGIAKRQNMGAQRVGRETFLCATSARQSGTLCHRPCLLTYGFSQGAGVVVREPAIMIPTPHTIPEKPVPNALVSHPAEELFREDSRLTECIARISAVDERGVQLDRTVFYPQGGGQAGDAGELILADGTRIAIADTRKGEAPGEIVHVPAAEQSDTLGKLRPGDTVTAQIDWDRRHRHMRFHTATHLLCALVPHPVDGCSITARYARLDFHMNEPLDKEALTAGIARLVAQAHPVRHRWIADAELDADPSLVRSMSVQPPRGSGRVRLLEIEEVDLQPCGGTHVANTSEVGLVIVTKIEKKSAMTRRVVLGFAP